MKIRFVYSSKLCKLLRVSGITLYPFVFLTTTRNTTPKRLKTHEMIHVFQIKRDGFFNFYIKYFIYWVRNLIKYRNQSEAYYNIPYEVQAYRYQDADFSEEDIQRLLS